MAERLKQDWSDTSPGANESGVLGILTMKTIALLSIVVIFALCFIQDRDDPTTFIVGCITGGSVGLIIGVSIGKYL